MGTPSELRMLPTAAEVEDPTTVFCGKELRMGPGRVTSTAGGSMTTVELWHCRTQHSLQLLASGQGPQGWQQGLQGWHCWHFSGQDMSRAWRCTWHRGQGGSRAHAHLRHSPQGTPSNTRPLLLVQLQPVRAQTGDPGPQPSTLLQSSASPSRAPAQPGCKEAPQASLSLWPEHTLSPLPTRAPSENAPEEQGAGTRAGKLNPVLERVEEKGLPTHLVPKEQEVTEVDETATR